MLLVLLLFCSVHAVGGGGMLERHGAELVLDGAPYAGIGACVVDLIWANNTSAIRDAAALGFPFVRFALSPYFPDQLAVWRDHPDAYWRQVDAAISAAREANVRLVPDLLWNVFAFADLCGEPLSALFNGSDSCARRTAAKFVSEAGGRYRGADEILFWELSNENNALVDGYFANASTGCNPAHGTPGRRTDLDNFDTGQMIATHAWLAAKLRAADPGRLINTGSSLPRPAAEHWRRTPRVDVARHRLDNRPDNESEFRRNLLDTNAAPAIDFVSGHVGGDGACAGRPFEANCSAMSLSLVELARETAHSAGQPFYLGERAQAARTPAPRGVFCLRAAATKPCSYFSLPPCPHPPLLVVRLAHALRPRKVSLRPQSGERRAVPRRRGRLSSPVRLWIGCSMPPPPAGCWRRYGSSSLLGRTAPIRSFRGGMTLCSVRYSRPTRC